MTRGIRFDAAIEEEIVKLLREANMSQAAIGAAVGVSQGAVSVVAIRHGLRRLRRFNSPASCALPVKPIEEESPAPLPSRAGKRAVFAHNRMMERKEQAVALYKEFRSLAKVARYMNLSSSSISKYCGDVILPPAPPPEAPKIIPFPPKRKLKDDLPLSIFDKITPEEEREREREDQSIRERREAENRTLREARPSGLPCRIKACPFPAMIGEYCRKHYIDSRAMSSTSSSSLDLRFPWGDQGGS